MVRPFFFALSVCGIFVESCGLVPSSCLPSRVRVLNYGVHALPEGSLQEDVFFILTSVVVI